MSKILDGLPISLDQVQHNQIRHQWPKCVVKNDHLYYDRDQEQNTQQKVVEHVKTEFKGIADITNGNFQGQYSPIDTVQQINSASGQQVKGEIIEQSIIPIHVMPTPQAPELTHPNDGPHCLTQIFQQRNTHDPNMYTKCRLTPLDHPPQRFVGDHQLMNQQNDTFQINCISHLTILLPHFNHRIKTTC